MQDRPLTIADLEAAMRYIARAMLARDEAQAEALAPFLDKLAAEVERRRAGGDVHARARAVLHGAGAQAPVNPAARLPAPARAARSSATTRA